jgi:outer membrane protein assembly factor BamC
MISAKAVFALSVIVVLTAACSSNTPIGKPIDYKSVRKDSASLDSLKLPPKLTKPTASEKYSGISKSEATLSEYHKRVESGAEATGQQILPSNPNIRVERDGIYRWLVVNDSAENIWDLVKQFWLEEGFLIASEDPVAGILETDWAENRAKMSTNVIAEMINRVVPLLVSSPERDKYRIRLERMGDTETGIFLSHEGMALVALPGKTFKTTKRVWQYRQKDPELESEMLMRLMVSLGVAEGDEILDQVAPGGPIESPQAIVSLEVDSEGFPNLIANDDFERVWRRLGIALETFDFSVTDKNRSDGVYYFRYNDTEASSKAEGWSRLAFWRDRTPVVKSYSLRIDRKTDSIMIISVHDDQGAKLKDETASRVLSVINEGLL